MGITAAKGKKGAMPAGPKRALGMPRRRNSLPPLPSSPPGQASACIMQGFVEHGNLNRQNKLPSIDIESTAGLKYPRHGLFDSFAMISDGDDDIEPILVTEPGFEEAEGISQSETLAQKYGEVKQDHVLYPTSKEIVTLENLNLCGAAGRCNTVKSKPVLCVEKEKTQESFKLPESGCLLTMQGNKAKCQARPVVLRQTTSLRPAAGTKNAIQNKLLNRRPQRKDIMVSMEERLAKSAKENEENRGRKQQTNTGHAKKVKRAKTAVARTRKNVCLLTCIKPRNLEVEKAKFMKSNYTYNPQFTYEYPASDVVLARYNRASSHYLPQAMAIMKRVLERYGNYEKFEWATGGQLLSKTQLWSTVKKYLQKEGFYGDVVVNISNDLIARAAMTITGGRPTLSIRESAAKKLWVEGLLRHEIGTHHLRFHNNRQQIWHNVKVRRQMGLKPANPTEEGLASLHSVLMRKDPSLWRSAILYYTIHKASQMSFCELFEDLGQYMDNPEVRWDYCIRSKRGQYDTSKPGCFCKDQVYLTGILQLLQVRHSLDFHLLCTMGKISYEDMEMLKPHHNQAGTKIPGFMEDLNAYRARLDHIVAVNGLEEWLQKEKPEENKNVASAVADEDTQKS